MNLTSPFPFHYARSPSIKVERDSRNDVNPRKRRGSQVPLDGSEAVDIPYSGAPTEGEFDHPYHPDDDIPSDQPFYHPSVQKAKISRQMIIDTFRAQLKDGSHDEEGLIYLAGLLAELEKPTPEGTPLQFDGPNAGTVVVTRYVSASPLQRDVFEVKIYFRDSVTYMELFKELLVNYISFGESETSEEEVDEEQQAELSFYADTTLTVFTQLFMAHPEMKDQDSTERFLSNISSAEDKVLLETLEEWTHQILEHLLSDSDDGNVIRKDFRTVDDLHRYITPFTRSVPFEESKDPVLRCFLSHLVESVQISVKDTILDHGLIFTDCAGTADILQTRERATKRALQNTDVTLVTANIKRAAALKEIQKKLRDAHRRGGTVIMVCTKADDVDLKAELGFELTAAEQKELDAVSAKRREYVQQINAATQALATAEIKTDIGRRSQIANQKDTMTLELNQLENEERDIRSLARTRYTREALGKRYQEMTKAARPLLVFGVGNIEYMKHLPANRDYCSPAFHVTSTGYPALRTKFVELACQAKFAELVFQCGSAPEMFLNAVEISCTVSKGKRREDLNKSCRMSRKKTAGSLQDIAEEFGREVVNQVRVKTGKKVEKESKWIDGARVKCKKWKLIKARAHQAVISHHGSWGSKNCPEQNWNEDLLNVLRPDLDSVFNQIRSQDTELLRKKISVSVKEALDKLDEIVKADPSSAVSGAIVAFRNNLKQRKQHIDKRCREFQDEINYLIGQIHRSTTTDGGNHYLVTAMKEIYDSSLKVKPTRKGMKLHNVRCAAFEKGLLKMGGVYMSIYRAIQKDLPSALQVKVKSLTKDLDTILDQTQHDIDQLCHTGDNDTPGTMKMNADLFALLPQGRAILRDITDRLDECDSRRRARSQSSLTSRHSLGSCEPGE
ncbi:hypothetical protein K491DRAFT_723463 [Lophiostoma macrostomum CBS 122681]|uniref:DUF7605 domain-containing protein n=1 Tax=Lophiostoma macrostomum CBS 122681 TaxID=1314788 RepID=A0A6A6SMK9_9PLEO|nr:hypothetical protein K491DRAFT_723463 [Lophiostoma macrostomum CBS 122681]